MSVVSIVRAVRSVGLRSNVLLHHPDGHRVAQPTAQRQQQDGKGQDQNTHGPILGRRRSGVGGITSACELSFLQ